MTRAEMAEGIRGLKAQTLALQVQTDALAECVAALQNRPEIQSCEACGRLDVERNLVEGWVTDKDGRPWPKYMGEMGRYWVHPKCFAGSDCDRRAKERVEEIDE